MKALREISLRIVIEGGEEAWITPWVFAGRLQPPFWFGEAKWPTQKVSLHSDKSQADRPNMGTMFNISNYSKN